MKLSYSLFDTLLEPIFVLDSSKRIVYCNETAAQLLSSTVRKLTRSNVCLTDLMTFSEPLEGLENLPSVTDPTPYKEVNFTTTEGGAGKVQVTFQKLPHVDHWITFVRDVTLEERLQKKYRGELDAKEGVIDELRKAQGELENYSRNLEKMVEERTAEVRGLNQKLKALLDSLDQGFLIFDQTGLCWEVTSKACETVLETKPAGQKIWDVLKLAPTQREGFSKWLTTLFLEMLPFDDLAVLGPKTFQHSLGRRIELKYYPIRASDQKIQAVVLVASDITSLVEAQEQAEKEKSHAGFILKMFQQKRSFLTFLEESKRQVSELKRLTQTQPSTWDREAVFRTLHTLKGGAASYSVRDLASTTHELETLIAKLSAEVPTFDSKAWTHLNATLEEQHKNLVAEAEKLLGSQANLNSIEVPRTELLKIFDLLGTWAKSQDFAEELRQRYFTEPLEESFQSFDYVIQKLAEQLQKKVAPLRIEPAGFRWDFDAYRSFLGSLVHVFRNAIDHGLESPEERKALGKPEIGLIQVSAQPAPGGLELRISDDGRGLNLFAIKQKMIQMGLKTEGLKPDQIYLHIFDSQFSTRLEVTELSGRGVGLDAVKAEVDRMGGSVRIETRENQGTTFIFFLPQKSAATAPRRAA
ncbi:MAG: ATP-binding protein [Bdellovibrionales bacterium]